MYEKHGKGVIAALLVHADLIKKGYQVFTEDTGQGLIDLVAVHLQTGETRYIDVKALARRADGSKINRVLKPSQRKFEEESELIIELVYADIETYEIQYPPRSRRMRVVRVPEAVLEDLGEGDLVWEETLVCEEHGEYKGYIVRREYE